MTLTWTPSLPWLPALYMSLPVVPSPGVIVSVSGVVRIMVYLFRPLASRLSAHVIMPINIYLVVAWHIHAYKSVRIVVGKHVENTVKTQPAKQVILTTRWRYNRHRFISLVLFDSELWNLAQMLRDMSLANTNYISDTTGPILIKLGWMMRLTTEICHLHN